MTSAMAMIADRYLGIGRVKFMSTQAVIMSGASMASSSPVDCLVNRLALSIFALRPRFRCHPDGARVVARNKAAGTAAGMRDKLDLGPLAIVGVTALLAMILFYMLPVRLPFHLHGLGYTSSTVAGFGVAVSTLTMSIAAMSLQPHGGEIADHAVYAAIFLCSGIGFVLIGWSTTLRACLLGSAIAGAGNGWLFPANNLLIMARAPSINAVARRASTPRVSSPASSCRRWSAGRSSTAGRTARHSSCSAQ